MISWASPRARTISERPTPLLRNHPRSRPPTRPSPAPRMSGRTMLLPMPCLLRGVESDRAAWSSSRPDSGPPRTPAPALSAFLSADRRAARAGDDMRFVSREAGQGREAFEWAATADAGAARFWSLERSPERRRESFRMAGPAADHRDHIERIDTKERSRPQHLESRRRRMARGGG